MAEARRVAPRSNRGFTDACVQPDDLGENGSQRGYSRSIPLLSAAQQGRIVRVQELISSGCDVNQQDSKGWTALTHTVAKGHWDCFQELSRAVCHYDLKSSKKIIGRLVSAVEEEAFDKALKLLGKYKLIQNLPNKEKAALVIFFIIHECQDGAFYEWMTDLNFRYHCGMTPLIVATIIGNNDVLKNILVHSKDIDLQIRDDFEKSALCYAVERSCPDTLEMIINAFDINKHRKALVNVVKEAVKLCVTLNQEQCMSILLNWNVNNDDIMQSSISTGALLCEAANEGSLQCLSKLLSLGVDVSWANHLGETALMFAVIKDRMECFNYLIKLGAQINAVDFEGNNALMHAVQWIRPKFIPRLLEIGGDVNMVNESQMSAIAMASCQNDTDILQQILSSLVKSSNIKLLLNSHRMAFNLAAKFFNINALVLLMEHNVFQWSWMNNTNNTMSPELIAQAAIRSHTRPGLFYWDCQWSKQTMTLLKLAFYFDNFATVRFLMANLYLSTYDIKDLPRDHHFVDVIRKRGSPQSVVLVNQLISQPWCLQTLSFLAISAAINDSNSKVQNDVLSKRKTLIQQLPLPQKFIDRLMFRCAISRICVDKWKSIGAQTTVLQSQKVNLMSRAAPIWKECDFVPPEQCEKNQCSNNHEGFRWRFQLLCRRKDWMLSSESTQESCNLGGH